LAYKTKAPGLPAVTRRTSRVLPLLVYIS
jgi:hypothetical protein